MTRNNVGLIICLVAAFGLAAPPRASADDDFGRIVHHIEAQYHVHRQHRFVMGLAGFVVKFYHFAGVKNLKGAIFENQPFLNAAGDTQFDEVIRRATNSSWQPMVQSWDRHSGERTYIYAQDAGKDMKVLLVSLESNEAVVLQLKVNPEKFSEFVGQATSGRNHHSGAPSQEIPPGEIVLASSVPPDWDGFCLLADQSLVEPSQP